MSFCLLLAMSAMSPSARVLAEYAGPILNPVSSFVLPEKGCCPGRRGFVRRPTLRRLAWKRSWKNERACESERLPLSGASGETSRVPTEKRAGQSVTAPSPAGSQRHVLVYLSFHSPFFVRVQRESIDSCGVAWGLEELDAIHVVPAFPPLIGVNSSPRGSWR